MTVDYVKRIPNASEPLLEVGLDVEYVGPDGNVSAPKATITDGQSPFKIYATGVNDGVGQDLDPNSPGSKVHYRLLQWISSPYNVSGPESRAVKNGEKFSPTYMVSDPLLYDGFTIAFADVPPIALRAPNDAKHE